MTTKYSRIPQRRIAGNVRGVAPNTTASTVSSYQKYVNDPAYKVERDASGKIVRVYKKPVSFTARKEKDSDQPTGFRITTGSYSPHEFVIKNGEVTEKYYDLYSPSRAGHFERYAPYAKSVIQYKDGQKVSATRAGVHQKARSSQIRTKETTRFQDGQAITTKTDISEIGRIARAKKAAEEQAKTQTTTTGKPVYYFISPEGTKRYEFSKKRAEELSKEGYRSISPESYKLGKGRITPSDLQTIRQTEQIKRQQEITGKIATLSAQERFKSTQEKIAKLQTPTTRQEFATSLQERIKAKGGLVGEEIVTPETGVSFVVPTGTKVQFPKSTLKRIGEGKTFEERNILQKIPVYFGKITQSVEQKVGLKKFTTGLPDFEELAGVEGSPKFKRSQIGTSAIYNILKGGYEYTRKKPYEVAGFVAAGYGTSALIRGVGMGITATSLKFGKYVPPALKSIPATKVALSVGKTTALTLTTPKGRTATQVLFRSPTAIKTVTGIKTVGQLTKGAIASAIPVYLGSRIYKGYQQQPTQEKRFQYLGKTAVQFGAFGVGGKLETITTPRAVGLIRGVGKKPLELTRITSEKTITGEQTFPTADPRQHLKIFKKQEFGLGAEKLVKVKDARIRNILGVKVKVKPKYKWQDIRPQDLPSSVPRPPVGAYHFSPEPLGKKFVTAKGTSELPGLYVSPEGSIYFTKIAREQSKVYSSELFPVGNLPTGQFIYSKGVRYSPYMATGKRVYQWTSPEKGGVIDVPGMKTEIEGLFRPGMEFKTLKTAFKTKIKGVTVPIYQYQYAGKETQSELLKNVFETSAGGVSGSGYRYSLYAKPTASPLFYGSLSRVKGVSSRNRVAQTSRRVYSESPISSYDPNSYSPYRPTSSYKQVYHPSYKPYDSRKRVSESRLISELTSYSPVPRSGSSYSPMSRLPVKPITPKIPTFKPEEDPFKFKRKPRKVRKGKKRPSYLYSLVALELPKVKARKSLAKETFTGLGVRPRLKFPR